MPGLSDIFGSDTSSGKDDGASAGGDPFVPAPGEGDDGGVPNPPGGDSTIASGSDGMDDFA